MGSKLGPGGLPVDPATGDGPRVVYFGFDAQNNAVIARISAFQHAGADVLGITYRRRDFNHGRAPTWENVDLGETSRGNYPRRVWVMLAAPRIIWANRERMAGASLFYARNLDMAVLALVARFFCGSKAPFVYEVRDVVPAVLGKGPRARALRWMERRVLARSQILDVSSPGFMENYFVPVQRYRGEWFLSENKIHGPMLRKAASKPRGDVAAKIDAMKRGRLVVGLFGAFRCVRSLEMLGELSDRLPLLVYLRGSPTAMRMDELRSFVARHPNMVFDGDFSSPRDLREIYGAIDVAWGFDFSCASTNSAWLLPRRLYEGAYCGVPLLAAAGTQTGRKVAQLGIGWTFEDPVMEHLEKFFVGVTADEVVRMKAHVASLPREMFCEEDDTGSLLRAVLEASFAPRRGVAR
jgi:succinoglycan biosynthesis protein ExoL